MSYDAFRHFADSWGLLFLALMWLSFGLWTFRPSAREHHEDAANMIFDESDQDG